MINRSLIRIKTVQILYSYLLTRRDFKLEAAPDGTASKDRIFAYNVYVDMLGLLLKLGGQAVVPDAGRVIPDDNVMRKNPVAASLAADSELRALIFANRGTIKALDSVLDEIYDAITASAIYTDYKRRRKLTVADHVTFLSTIFETVVRRNKNLERILRRDENFSHVGLDLGLKMFTTTLEGYDDSRATYKKAHADLETAMRQAYNLYHALIALPIYITRLQEQRLDAAKHKYIPTAEDLNPSTRLIDNKYVRMLEEDEALRKYLTDQPDADPSNWRDSDILFGSLLDSILSSQLYADYMEREASFNGDASFWREVTKTIIMPSDELAEAMETKSVYWNDDLDIMSTFVLKTIRRTYAPGEDGEEPTGRISLLPMFMNQEDEAFGTELFEKVVANRLKYRELIDGFINKEQWDLDRIALMDIIVLMTAIAEICDYPKIPAQVTMNEYVDIANHYSTPGSGRFVNGVLLAVVKQLNGEEAINKPV